MFNQIHLITVKYGNHILVNIYHIYEMNLMYYFVYVEYFLLTKIKIIITPSIKISY